MTGLGDPHTWGDVLEPEHVEWCLENDDWPRFELCQTDYGWACEATIRTAGACASVSQRFMLPPEVSEYLDDLYQEAEDFIIFEGGLGVVVDLPDDFQPEALAAVLDTLEVE